MNARRSKIANDQCPECGGELDTGWECNSCGFDARPEAMSSDEPLSFWGFLSALLLILLGTAVAMVGGIQIYMATVAALVGTQAFEISNRELATMGFNLLGMGIAAITLGCWTAN